MDVGIRGPAWELCPVWVDVQTKEIRVNKKGVRIIYEIGPSRIVEMPVFDNSSTEIQVACTLGDIEKLAGRI